jgi:hypothetical protein
MRRLALWLTFVLVVLPTTLLSLVFSLFGIAWMTDSLRPSTDPMDDRHRLASLMALAVLAAGWFGIATLWRLFVLLKRDWRSSRPREIWAGLLAGSAVSVVLIVMTPTAVAFVYAWPLLAVLHFGVEFARHQPVSRLRHLGR